MKLFSSVILLLIVQLSECSSPKTEKLLKKIFKNDDEAVNMLEALVFLPEKVKNKAIVLIPVELLAKSAKIKKEPFRVLLDASDGDTQSLNTWNKIITKTNEVDESTDELEESTQEPEENIQIAELIDVPVKFENNFFIGKYMRISYNSFLSNSKLAVFMSHSEHEWTIKVAGKSDSSDEDLYFIRTKGPKGFEYMQISRNFYYDRNRRYVHSQMYKLESTAKTKKEAMWFIRQEPSGSFTIKNALVDEYLYGAAVNEKAINNLVLSWVPKDESGWEGDEYLKREWKITRFER